MSLSLTYYIWFRFIFYDQFILEILEILVMWFPAYCCLRISITEAGVGQACYIMGDRYAARGVDRFSSFTFTFILHQCTTIFIFRENEHMPHTQIVDLCNLDKTYYVIHYYVLCIIMYYVLWNTAVEMGRAVELNSC